jgi:prepilin-type N-terminal cleavage/methylation domain-containing protein
MSPKFFKMGQRGFSLVELMIVVAIIGILSALAVPRFQKFQAKAKQSEVKNNLSHIYTLQQSFYGDNDRYSNRLADIGFSVEGTARYTYTLPAASDTAFRARGTATANIVAGCTTKDTWEINETKAWNPVADAVKTCN